MHQQITCSQCGQAHPLDEMEGSFRLPDVAARLPAWRRWLTVRSDGNFCAIGGRRFFVRGLLGFPVREWGEAYCWGIWVEVDRDTYDHLARTRYDEGREAGPPRRGALANELPLFGQPTLGAAVAVRVQPVGSAPHFIVADPGLPVAREQHAGIGLERVMEFTHFAVHGMQD